ncbi:MAG: cytochrome c oxidase assembly factor Coa1 family protein [Acidobacteriota bacterium]
MDDDAPPPKRSRRTCLLVVLPVGGCLVAVLACVGVCGLAGGGAYFGMTKSEPARIALATAQRNPDVVKAFGGKIEAGLLPQGSIHVENDGGNADITIPISGPSGKGTVHVVATKSSGAWTIDSLIVAKPDANLTWDLTSEARP